MLSVLHINDVANVGSTLVAGLQEKGNHIVLRRMKNLASSSSLMFKMFLIPCRIAEFIGIIRYFDSNGFDVLHIHYAYFGWIGIIGRIPYYLHCHGSDVRMGLEDPVRRKWTIPCIKHAKAVFFSTPDLADYVRSIRPDAVFLPNPVRTDLFCPPVLQSHLASSPKHHLRILLLSSLNDAVKGTHVAIQALSQVYQLNNKLDITAIAIGPDKNKYLSLEWINFVQPIPYMQMPSFLQQFDIIIGQFVIGSLGMSELEALSTGIPVICYYRDSAEYHTPPPVLPAQHADEVITHLNTLMNSDALRENLGTQGRKWILDNHCYKKVTDRLLEFYQYL